MEAGMRNPLYNDAAQGDDPDRLRVEAARGGDKAALEQLIAAHQAWIYKIAFRMVMDHEDACDITQEILIRIITHLALYDPEKGAFRTWVYRIVVNYVLNMKKRKFEHCIDDFDAFAADIKKALASGDCNGLEKVLRAILPDEKAHAALYAEWFSA
jgi:RNA polymerase sigma factor (sigma-70 family)